MTQFPGGVRGLRLHITTHFQSQRDCVLQPRVARNELPWDQRRQNQFQPRMRLCPLESSRPHASGDCVTNWRNSFGVEMDGGTLTQGSSFLATLGFEAESRWDSRCGICKKICV